MDRWRYMKKWINYIFIISLIGVLTSCQQSEYSKLVKSELAKNIHQDSIFFGIEFGETSKSFYAKCWDLNNQGIISHGPKNMNVKYIIEVEDDSDIQLLFYPVFDKDGKIKKMDAEFSYEAWSPWNTAYSADNLLPIVKDTLEAWHGGNQFLKLNIDQVEIWAKVDGNRRISMKSDGKQNVLVKYIDMLHEENNMKTKE